jgi:hypothetical protein
VALLLAVLALVLRAAQQSPPAIAEFAPQAQQIRQAPQEQTAAVGTAPNGAPLGSRAPSPSPSPAAAPGTAQLLRCVGDPPRQTEDPQSPPCVASWSGSNGGSTYHNVFPNRLNIFQTSLNGSSQGADTACGGADYLWEPYLFRYFNARYETYDRLLNPICNTDVNPMGDDSHQRADAIAADQQYHAFLATTYRAYGGFYFYDQMAKQKLLVAESYPVLTEEYMSGKDPYLWQYHLGLDRQMAMEGQWICSRLAGHPASYAGDPTYTSRTRSFAVYLDQENDPSLDYAPMLSALAECGIKPYAFKTYNDGSTTGPSSQDQQEYVNAVAAMRSQSITSVVCICLSISGGVFASEAQSAGYNPEWILSTYFGCDFEYLMRQLWPATELKHAFGVSFQPPWHTTENDPAAWAVREGGGTPPNDEIDQFLMDETYRALLVAVSGIQMAGPDLTPASFRAGLQHAVFPNPETPQRMGDVSFAGSHGMTTDLMEFWWSFTDAGSSSEDTAGSGVICYPNGGRRYSQANLPRWPDQMFQEPCDATPGG